MNQVSGAVVAPASANGMAETQAAVPRTAMNGSWTSDARGSQWALLGIGRCGSAGRTPPVSTKAQMKSTLNPWPAWRARATST